MVLYLISFCALSYANNQDAPNEHQKGHYDPCYGRVMYGAYQMWHPNGCPTGVNPPENNSEK